MDTCLVCLAFLLSVRCEPEFEWIMILRKSLTNSMISTFITLLHKAADILLSGWGVPSLMTAVSLA